MPEENKLQVIVRESGLEPVKASYMLAKFEDCEKVAAEWMERAKTIVVTDVSQKADMQIARVGRLLLRDKLTLIEKIRVEQKAQVLAEGRAIDAVAKYFKGLIEPVKQYLDEQEHFAERKAAEEAEQRRLEGERLLELARIEAEKKAEEERIAREKAEAEERERIRQENERLKREAEEREKKAEAERKEQERILAAERAKADAERKRIEEERRKEREAAEAKQREVEEAARKEREEAQRREREIQERADRERREREEAERQEKEKREAERKRVEAEAAAKLETERKAKEALEARLASMVTCPRCGRKFVPGEAEEQASLPF